MKKLFKNDQAMAVLSGHLMVLILVSVKTTVAGMPVGCSTHLTVAYQQPSEENLSGVGMLQRRLGLL